MYNYNSKVYPTPILDPVRLRFALGKREGKLQRINQSHKQMRKQNWRSGIDALRVAELEYFRET
jgi:hypothetical protein